MLPQILRPMLNSSGSMALNANDTLMAPQFTSPVLISSVLQSPKLTFPTHIPRCLLDIFPGTLNSHFYLKRSKTKQVSQSTFAIFPFSEFPVWVSRPFFSQLHKKRLRIIQQSHNPSLFLTSPVNTDQSKYHSRYLNSPTLPATFPFIPPASPTLTT